MVLVVFAKKSSFLWPDRRYKSSGRSISDSISSSRQSQPISDKRDLVAFMTSDEPQGIPWNNVGSNRVNTQFVPLLQMQRDRKTFNQLLKIRVRLAAPELLTDSCFMHELRQHVFYQRTMQIKAALFSQTGLQPGFHLSEDRCLGKLHQAASGVGRCHSCNNCQPDTVGTPRRNRPVAGATSPELFSRFPGFPNGGWK